MKCSLCSAKMRVERICGVCDQSVCSGCSRKVLGSSTVCHRCIAPDFSGRRTNQSYQQGYSELGRIYTNLMREKKREQDRLALAAQRANP